MQKSPIRGASGEYRIYDEIGIGGMASVHIARFLGTAGFARTVAVKRPLPALQQSLDFRLLATREALLAARVQHSHVVATLDVIDSGSEFLIVMEYVHGEALSTLTALARERGQRVPVEVAVSLMGGVLRGLSAVHQARDERGKLLELIHRDVSPQNIMCGADGVAKLADFGLAKAAGVSGLSNTEQFKGKLTYASPEQVELRPLTFASDLYALGVVLWELLSGERLYRELTAAELVAKLLRGVVPPPSQLARGLPASLDAVVLRALAREPEQRHASALAMATALEACVRPASVEDCAQWVCGLAAESLAERARWIMTAESETSPSQREPQRVDSQSSTRESASGAGLVSSERDPSVRRASRLAAPVKTALLRLFAMSAGVSLVWFAGERLWPRARPEPPRLGASDSAFVPSPAAAVSVPHQANAGVDAGRSAKRPSVNIKQGALRPGVSRAIPARSGAAAAPLDCSPPFSVDAEGIRHMKPGCK